MKKKMTTLCLPLLALVAVVPVIGADPPVEPLRTFAEVRIDLPEDTAPAVSVSHGEGRILLDLPRGAVFPLDFRSSSAGLLKGGSVVPLDADRVRLELELARGLLDRIDYAPDHVLLHFQSRFATRRMAELDSEYRIGTDDRILFSVHNQPDMEKQLTVTRNGTITVPLLGDVPAAGLTQGELAAKLTDMLGRSYLVDPQVDVQIAEYNSQWVMVSGEVREAGRVPLRGGTRLKEVLSIAGGFDREAGETIALSRADQSTGAFEVMRIDRREFENGEINPVLRHGDIVEVPRASFCYVQGEVRKPGAVKVERGMTLLKAISLAAGLTEWADKRQVQVIYPEGRDGVTVAGEVYDLKKIRNAKMEDPSLRGDEIIIVKRRFF